MSDNSIIVENLSKRYLIGHRTASFGGRYKNTTLRDVIAREIRNATRKTVDVIRGRQVVQGDEVEDFWALKDVSFEVKKGEVFGIIGRNGAGKSTLLKILSRITEPTKGRVSLWGRVSSLLEVGTGFHPELTGRENIFLNGAILGMTQREIRKKFDEIVAFAEVDKFIDTPVKHYSSGMYVRLAFAVSAHLEPEILIVDEVLAVGDTKFQKKCLEKMRNVATEGRTILFVSHNMSAVLKLCTRAILLSQGQLDFVGAPTNAVEKYNHSNVLAPTQFDVTNVRRHGGTGEARIVSLRFNRSVPYFGFAESICYSVRVKAERNIDRLRIGMTIFASDGTPVGTCFSPEIDGLMAGKEQELFVELPSAGLAPGHYSCGVSVGRGDHRSSLIDYDIVLDTLYFQVEAEEPTSGLSTAWYPASWGSISFPDLVLTLAKTNEYKTG